MALGHSDRDHGRGARFRKPSPFFACGHGYRKVHGPFTPWSTRESHTAKLL